MACILYPFYVALSLIVNVACLFLNPFAAAFADDAGNLPSWLKWFQTFDNDLDAGQRAGNTNFNWRYLNRVFWLYRNSAYGFDYYPFGKIFNPEKWRVVKFIDTPEKTLFFAVGDTGFNYYYIGPWGSYKFGWKAWNCYTNGAWSKTPFGPEWRVPLAFSPNPCARKQ